MNVQSGDWRDGAMVMSPCYISKGTEFASQPKSCTKILMSGHFNKYLHFLEQQGRFKFSDNYNMSRQFVWENILGSPHILYWIFMTYTFSQTTFSLGPGVSRANQLPWGHPSMDQPSRWALLKIMVAWISPVWAVTDGLINWHRGGPASGYLCPTWLWKAHQGNKSHIIGRKMKHTKKLKNSCHSSGTSHPHLAGYLWLSHGDCVRGLLSPVKQAIIEFRCGPWRSEIKHPVTNIDLRLPLSWGPWKVSAP